MTARTPDLELPEDYVDMFRTLDGAGAEYLVIGGWAVSVHGHGNKPSGALSELVTADLGTLQTVDTASWR